MTLNFTTPLALSRPYLPLYPNPLKNFCKLRDNLLLIPIYPKQAQGICPTPQISYVSICANRSFPQPLYGTRLGLWIQHHHN